MSCCDYNCIQGPDCPVRAAAVAKVGQRTPAAEPLPTTTWRDRLKRWGLWALVVVSALVVAGSWAIVAVTADFAPSRRAIDCGMASFHPDFTPAMREACRKRGARVH